MWSGGGGGGEPVFESSLWMRVSVREGVFCQLYAAEIPHHLCLTGNQPLP